MNRKMIHLHDLNHRDSISRRLRMAFTMLIVLLLIPSLVILVTMVRYTNTYSDVIYQVERVSSLKPLVQTQIGDEMWYVVAGHKSFDGADQYQMIDHVNSEIEALAQTADPENKITLTVARRTMDTLVNYIDRMGEMIRTEQSITESEMLLEEVRNVSSLVYDMLSEYADDEIRAAAQVSKRLQTTLNYVMWILFALVVGTLIFVIAMQRSLLRSIHTPIDRLEAFAAAVAGGDLQARAPDTSVTELRRLTESLNTMAGRLQNLIDENKREQENLKKSELRTLQAQINPHFLYNTLDAIVWLAEAGSNKEVIHITSALSDFFRISLSQGRDFITLADEIKHLTGYLTIQKIRYRDILDYEIDIPEALYNASVLKLMLQPLVENALYHGIKHRRGRGMIWVKGFQEGDRIVLTVRDNGAGMTRDRLDAVRRGLRAERPGEMGYGLFNVNKRIQLYYNQPQGIWIDSEEGSGTCITLKVPMRSC